MRYFFESERLGFRDWLESDLFPFTQLNQDSRVMEHFPSIFTMEQTKLSIQNFKRHQQDFGYTFYAVDERTNGNFIGFIGLKNVTMKVHFAPSVEIGWRLSYDAWGQGFATEGAAAVLYHAFHELNIPEVHSFTTTTNWRSERVMQKIGMQKIGTFEHPLLEDGHRLKTHVLYRITK